MKLFVRLVIIMAWKKLYKRRGFRSDSSELAYIPDNLVPVTEEDLARKVVLKLIDVLEDLEDVKSVHGNYDIEHSLLQQIIGP